MYNEKHSIRPLVFLCLFALVAAIVWSSQATLHEIVRGNGRIIPQSRTQPVQHLEGGIIQGIFVKEGQQVSKGEQLFMIDSLATNSEYNELRITRLFTEIKIMRLQAEQSGAETFQPDVSTEVNAAEFIEAQKEIFQAQKNEIERHIKILDEQINQKSLQIKKLEAELVNRQAEIDVVSKQLAIDKRLFDKGVISKSKLLDSESRVSSQETKVQMVKDDIPVAKAELQEAKEKKQQITESFQIKITDELSKEKVKLEQIEERLKTLEDRLNRAVVTSPSDGIVNRLLVNTSGQVVKPGDTLLELTPSNSPILVEGRLRAEDRGRTWIGQDAIVRVSAYDFSKYGALTGKVEDISADSFVDETGNTFYRVKIGLNLESLQKNSNDLKILPGMTVDFHIKAGVRTVMQMVLSPVLEEVWFSFSSLEN